MIPAPSLIPAPRVIKRKKRSRIRGWTGVVVLTALLGSTGSVLARTWISDPTAATTGSIVDAHQRLDDLITQRDALLAETASAAQTLRAAKTAADHPDWSILIAYVANLCGDRITLSNLSLEPNGEGFDVHIRGDGPTQQDIASFILGLEGSGVFASTRLENSGSPESTSSVSFSVICLIRPGGQVTPSREDAG